MNYFIATKDSPAHLSVGAIVINAQGQFACHYFKEIRGYKDIYILMRETLEPNEALETALNRGLMEEWGLKAKLQTFLGSLISRFEENNIQKTKTTLYFLMKFTEQHDEWRHAEDPERASQIQWHDADFLISKMKDQVKKYTIEHLDESAIVKVAQVYLSKS